MVYKLICEISIAFDVSVLFKMFNVSISILRSLLPVIQTIFYFFGWRTFYETKFFSIVFGSCFRAADYFRYKFYFISFYISSFKFAQSISILLIYFYSYFFIIFFVVISRFSDYFSSSIQSSDLIVQPFSDHV